MWALNGGTGVFALAPQSPGLDAGLVPKSRMGELEIVAQQPYARCHWGEFTLARNQTKTRQS